MNTKVAVTLSSLVFGGIGFGVGYFISKRRYLMLADNEINSIKASQKSHDEWIKKFYGIGDQKVEAEKIKENPIKINNPTISTITPATIGPEEDRLEEEKKYRDITKPYVPNKNIPYLISSMEFNESSNPMRSLYYYEDGYVTDIDSNVINNYAELIGPINLWIDNFTKKGKTIIYIRNDETEMDYEVIKCSECWMDIASPTQKALMLNVSKTDDDNK